jgi:DNA-binding transcriptional LysR family regulator
MLKMALEGEAAVVMPDDAVASHVQAGSLVAIRSSIGEGHRYMLLGPNARNAQAAKVVEFLRDRVLARRRGLATSVKLPAAEEAHW